MAMLALCMPILPGKMEKWQAMINQVKSTPTLPSQGVGRSARKDLCSKDASRGLLIITLEGDNPVESWAKITSSMPPDLQSLLWMFTGCMLTPHPRHCRN